MEKRKYISPRTSKVSVRMDGYFLMASESKYYSTGLGKGDGISGDGDAGDAAGALSRTDIWDD